MSFAILLLGINTLTQAFLLFVVIRMRDAKWLYQPSRVFGTVMVYCGMLSTLCGFGDIITGKYSLFYKIYGSIYFVVAMHLFLCTVATISILADRGARQIRGVKLSLCASAFVIMAACYYLVCMAL